MKLCIKNMVSNRCKTAVREELKKLGLHYIIVDLGEVEIMEDISAEEREQLRIALLAIGLELLDCKKAMLNEKIKNVITDMIYYSDELPRVKFSDYISEKLKHNYTYLSNLFTDMMGISIQQYMMMLKIERVKELMLYDELNMTEISYKLQYSSVAALSNQFKQITGLTTSEFKQLKNKGRTPIEELGKPTERVMSYGMVG